MKQQKLAPKKLKLPSFLKGIVPKFSLGILSGILTALPSLAAENIHITYGSIKLSVRVESLIKYAETGVANKNLSFYLGFVDESGQQGFREALNQKTQVDAVLLSRLLNTAIGEDILRRLGTVINIPWGIDGKFAIRGGLVQSAFEPEGLSLLGFFQKFPTDMQLNLNRALLVAQRVDKTIQATEATIEEIKQLSAREAKSEEPVNFAQLPDLSKPGEYGFVEETITLTDPKRNRKFRVLLYKPQRFKLGKTPVIVVSHGLASRPEDFADNAQHLASHGFLVALPQHPGSDLQQAKDLIEGFSREVFQLNEFIDRPADISYVLDYLEQQNQAVYGGRLNLTEVGVVGHSFGGYGALAVAGATIDFNYLEQECDLTIPRLNTSLLLQCRALDLPRQEYNFRDQRVAAVMAVNPVNSSIFGPEGLSKISLPIMMVAGTYDPATPAIYEQFRSFPWLSAQNKYLALVEGQAHVNFSNLDPGIQETVESISNLTLASPQILQRYGGSFLMPFFGFYVENDPIYQPYINSIASYSEHLSEGQEFKIFLVTQQSADALKQTVTDLGFN
jgi:predicted dienelactone hydrolase